MQLMKGSERIFQRTIRLPFMVFVLASSACPIEPECQPSSRQPAAEILWMREICRETNRQIGWPTVCRRRSGELLAVFSGDRDRHVCPFGKVQMVRSADDGETWGAPETLVDDALDDRDAGIIELDNGDLLLFYFNSVAYAIDVRNPNYEKYLRHYRKIPRETVIRELGYFSRRSTDGGRTWELPVRMYVSAPHGGIQLRDGRVMAVGRHWNAEGNVPPEVAARQPGVHEIAVEVSADRGRSWSVLTKIVPPAPFDVRNLHEPHLLELEDGRIVVQCNDLAKGRHLLQFESADGGRSWGEFRELPQDGCPAHLLRLADGRTLCSFACRRSGHEGEYAMVSSDGCRTWTAVPEVTLSRGLCGDLGYPSTAQLADGSLLTVYYQSARHRELPVLMATKWRLVK